MKNPKVSVIIPVHNGEKWIRDSIRSVRMQTHRNLEILVIDDCSTDNSVQKVRDLDDPRITILENDTNQGIAASRNRGIRHSSGQFIGFLDQDDRWFKHKLEKQLKQFLDAPENTGVVYSDVEIYNTNNNYTDIDSFYQLPSDHKCRITEIFLNNPITNISTLIRSECFETHGLLDEGLFGSDDYEFWLRIAKEYNFEYIDEALAQKRLHDDNASMNLDQMVDDRLNIADRYVNEYCFLSEYYARRLAFIRMDAARQAFGNRKYDKGLQYILRSLFETPRESLKLSLRGGQYLISEKLKD